MALVTTKEMFEKAMQENYAIGAFNVNNMEIIQGIVDAAAEANSPVILQVSSSAIKYARINYLMKMVQAAVEEHPNIPIAIHLDHGPDFETAKMCIDNGFTSVMIDGSKYDLKTPIGNGKNTLYGMMKSKKRQANNFVICADKTELSTEELKRQIKAIYTSRNTTFVDTIVLIRNKQIVKVYRRNK